MKLLTAPVKFTVWDLIFYPDCIVLKLCALLFWTMAKQAMLFDFPKSAFKNFQLEVAEKSLYPHKACHC